MSCVLGLPSCEIWAQSKSTGCKSILGKIKQCLWQAEITVDRLFTISSSSVDVYTCHCLSYLASCSKSLMDENGNALSSTNKSQHSGTTKVLKLERSRLRSIGGLSVEKKNVFWCQQSSNQQAAYRITEDSNCARLPSANFKCKLRIKVITVANLARSSKQLRCHSICTQLK